MADEADLRRAVLSVRNVLWIAVAVLLLLLAVEALPMLIAARAARAARAAAKEGLQASPTAGAAEVKRGSSGTIRTPLGYGIVLNKESSLEREWVVVNGPPVPASIVGPAGVVTEYKAGGYSGQFMYKVAFELDAKEPLTAVEIQFLTFDVWGNHDRKLSLTDVADFGPGQKTFTGEWNVASENEASEFYASIAYVARVRTKAGRVIQADVVPVVQEARRFSERFSASDIDPRPPFVLPSPSPASH